MGRRDTGCDNQKWISLAQDGVKYRSNCVEPSGYIRGE